MPRGGRTSRWRRSICASRPRRHRQPQLVPAGAIDARGRGGLVGGPIGLCLPRLGGRCRSGHREPDPAAGRGEGALRRAPGTTARGLHRALVATVQATGRIGMDNDMAEALAAFRACNYEHIYLRDASRAQGEAVVSVLRALVEHYADRPNAIPPSTRQGASRAGRPRPCTPLWLRGRHDRPLRVPPGGRRPRLGSGETAERRRGLSWQVRPPGGTYEPPVDA